MELDLAKPGAAEVGKVGEVGGLVLLDREEKRMPGGSAVAVAERGEQSEDIRDPGLHPARATSRGITPLWLVVVGDAEEQMNRT